MKIKLCTFGSVPKYQKSLDVLYSEAIESKYFDEYMTRATEVVVMPDGRWLSFVDDEFKVDGPYGPTFIIPEHLERRNVPNCEIWPTVESFMADWHNGERDPVICKYGYWENPNAKWDYWRICHDDDGWTPFPLKAGGYAFQGYKRDIDLEKLQLNFESPHTVIVNGQWFDSFIDGKWCDCGFSSWWNSPSALADAMTWDAKVIELISSLDDNTLLTLVDCHI